MSFHHVISERLKRIRDQLKEDPDFLADRMMQGRFERIKCSFGSAGSSTIPTIPLPVPGLPAGSNFPSANIEDSKMIISRYMAHTVDGVECLSLTNQKEKSSKSCSTFKSAACLV